MKLTLLVAALAVFVCACGTTMYRDDRAYSPAYYVPPAAHGQIVQVGDHQLVCHKGKKTLDLPPEAVDAHLRHGDHRGTC